MNDTVLNPSRSLAKLDEALLAEKQRPTAALGASTIAEKDARTLWLRFRWCLPDELSPKTLRIFRLGRIIEDEVIELLRMAGFEVHNTDGDGRWIMYRYLGGHYKLILDGVIKGLLESQQWHVLEIKTMNRKKFAELKKEGVKKAEPNYFGQVQVELHATEMTRGLLVAYCKDTSELHFERIEVDKFFGPAMLEKAEQIVTGPLPASTYPDRTWYEIAKFKSDHYQSVYWGDELPPTANCRNCRWSVPDVEDPDNTGAWGCRVFKKQLDLEEQIKGCPQHNFLPELMPAELIATHDDHGAVEYKTKDGFTFWNVRDSDASTDQPAFTSLELIQFSKLALSKETLNDEVAKAFKKEMDARTTHIAIPGRNEEPVF